MRTQREIEHATIDSHLQTSSMGMELNATSFNHIISNLYRNPLGAVFRELTTNAIEAHVDAKTNKRVAIQLPSTLSQEFIIRDFGKGLSHDDVMKYLNTLFSSSKSNDNEARGGFGLGSKSPLALVDSFHLTSIHNGLKNTYAWIREGGKLPTLIRMGDEEDFDEKTTEDNGITITIPLGSSSKLNISQLTRICNQEARRQLFAFTKEMILLTDNIQVDKYEDLNDITEQILVEERILSLKNVDIFKANVKDHDQVLKQGYITVGDVAYPLDGNTSFKNVLNFFKNPSKYAFAFKAPIGALDIPMSREEVLSTHNNNTVISKIIADAVVDVRKHIESLNINLDCSITDFYDQLKNVKTSSSTIEFVLDISEDSFQKHEKVLTENFTKIYKSVRPNSFQSRYGELHYTDLKRGTRASTYLTALLSKIEELDQIKMFLYDSSLQNKSRLKDPYYCTREFDMSDTAYSFILTSLPLAGGITNIDIERYIEHKLKPKHPVVLLQVRDQAFSFVQRAIDIGVNIQKNTTSLTEISETFPVLDADDIKAFKAVYKAANKTTTTVTRSTYDFVPGLRIHDLFKHHVYTTTSNNAPLTIAVESEEKVYKLINVDGKTIGVGPEYLDDKKVDKSKPVFLISKGEPLPLDISAFLPVQADIPFNVNCSLVKEQLQGITLVTVQERSFAKALERFEEDGSYTVYHKDNLFKVERKEFKDLTVQQQSSFLLPCIRTHAFKELFKQSSLYSFRNTDALLIKELSDIFYKSLEEVASSSPLFLNVLPSFKNKTILDLESSVNLYSNVRGIATVKFDEKTIEKEFKALDSIFFKELVANQNLKKYAISLVRQDYLKESLLVSYFANIVS